MKGTQNGGNKDSNYKTVCLKYLQFQHFVNSTGNSLHSANSGLVLTGAFSASRKSFLTPTRDCRIQSSLGGRDGGEGGTEGP